MAVLLTVPHHASKISRSPLALYSNVSRVHSQLLSKARATFSFLAASDSFVGAIVRSLLLPPKLRNVIFALYILLRAVGANALRWEGTSGGTSIGFSPCILYF